jgi:hypothetical protein
MNYLKYVLLDSENYEGVLNIGGKKHEFKDSEKSIDIDIEIDSFSVPLKYNFSIESLPIDSLLENNTIIESSPCTDKKDSCLQSKESDLILERCKSNYELLLSYKVNDEEVYKNDTEFSIKEFKFKINLKCK